MKASWFVFLAAVPLFSQSTGEQPKTVQPGASEIVLPGEVIGRVVDEESGKPRANFSIAVARFYYRYGTPYVDRGGLTAIVTDIDGRFRLTDMAPGRYVAIVAPESVSGAKFSTEFSQDDTKAVDQDYETSYWPGGGGLDTAASVVVPPGGFGYIGTIKIRKTPFYRIHVSVPAEGCKPGEIVQVQQGNVTDFLASRRNLGKVPCGRDFLIRNVQPGSYALILSTDGGRLQDTIPVDVKDRNINVKVSLHPGADLDGRVVRAEGAGSVPLDHLQIATGSRISLLDITRPVTPDAEGKFRLANLALGPRRLELSGLDTNYYVKELRYNDMVVTNRVFSVMGRGSLQVVIDDKPARISGVVSDGDRPVRKSYVMLSKWPPESDYVHIDPRGTNGSEDGGFQFAGLAPGEYRIFAVSQADRTKLDEPGVLDRLFNGAEKISLDFRASQNVTLTLTDPSR